MVPLLVSVAAVRLIVPVPCKMPVDEFVNGFPLVLRVALVAVLTTPLLVAKLRSSSVPLFTFTVPLLLKVPLIELNVLMPVPVLLVSVPLLLKMEFKTPTSL